MARNESYSLEQHFFKLAAEWLDCQTQYQTSPKHDLIIWDMDVRSEMWHILKEMRENGIVDRSNCARDERLRESGEVFLVVGSSLPIGDSEEECLS